LENFRERWRTLDSFRPTNMDVERRPWTLWRDSQVLGVRFGEESDPTIYWRDRKADRPRYHIDYCFLPESWIPYTSVTVGSFDEWMGLIYLVH